MRYNMYVLTYLPHVSKTIISDHSFWRNGIILDNVESSWQFGGISRSLLVIFCSFSSKFVIFGQLLPTFRQCWLRLTNWRCLFWSTIRLTLSPGIASFIQNQCDKNNWYTFQSNHFSFLSIQKYIVYRTIFIFQYTKQ